MRGEGNVSSAGGLLGCEGWVGLRGTVLVAGVVGLEVLGGWGWICLVSVCDSSSNRDFSISSLRFSVSTSMISLSGLRLVSLPNMSCIKIFLVQVLPLMDDGNNSSALGGGVGCLLVPSVRRGIDSHNGVAGRFSLLGTGFDWVESSMSEGVAELSVVPVDSDLSLVWATFLFIKFDSSYRVVPTDGVARFFSLVFWSELHRGLGTGMRDALLADALLNFFETTSGVPGGSCLEVLGRGGVTACKANKLF